MLKPALQILTLLCATSAALAQTASLSASYIVPTAKDGSSPAVQYPVSPMSITVDAQNLPVLTFALPEDLVSPQASPVVLTGPTPGALTGAFVGTGISANCIAAAPSPAVSCQMTYTPGYTLLDSSVVSAFLNKKYSAQPAVLATKLIQAANFRADPEGTIEFAP